MVCLSLLTTKKRRYKGFSIYNYIFPKLQVSLLLNYEACQSPKNEFITLILALLFQKINYDFPDYLSSSAKYVMKMIELKIDPGL